MPDIVGRLKPPRLSAPPSSPTVGEMYYDTTTNKLYWYNGTVWIDSTGGAGADLVYNGAFPANTPYTDGDVVMYNGIAYMCVRPTSAAPTPWPSSVGNGVSFMAYPAGTTSYPNGVTVMPCDTKEFDTSGWLDTVTNKGRYTPKVPGYYRLGGTGYLIGIAANVAGQLRLRKNGTFAKILGGATSPNLANQDIQASGSAVVFANGTTDYFELEVFNGDVTARNGYGGGAYQFFCGERVA